MIKSSGCYQQIIKCNYLACFQNNWIKSLASSNSLIIMLSIFCLLHLIMNIFICLAYTLIFLFSCTCLYYAVLIICIFYLVTTKVANRICLHCKKQTKKTFTNWSLNWKGCAVLACIEVLYEKNDYVLRNTHFLWP